MRARFASVRPLPSVCPATVSPTLGWRRPSEQPWRGAGDQSVDVDLRGDRIVVLVDQERCSTVDERPQSQCNLLRISAHLVALAVACNLVDDVREARMAGAHDMLGLFE